MLIAPVLKHFGISCTIFRFFNVDRRNDFLTIFHPVFHFYGCSTLAEKQEQMINVCFFCKDNSCPQKERQLLKNIIYSYYVG